jgi:hypothetical protein
MRKKSLPVPNFVGYKHYPMGGHVWNPPVDCAFAFSTKDSGRWADHVICKTKCGRECDPRRLQKGMSPNELKRYLAKQNVGCNGQKI